MERCVKCGKELGKAEGTVTLYRSGGSANVKLYGVYFFKRTRLCDICTPRKEQCDG